MAAPIPAPASQTEGRGDERRLARRGDVLPCRVAPLSGLRRHAALAAVEPGARPGSVRGHSPCNFVGGRARSARWRLDRVRALPVPAYWGTEHFYGRGMFGRDEFEQLSRALNGLQGRFIPSLNDVPEVRELFAWTEIETVELSYQAGGAGHDAGSRVDHIEPLGFQADPLECPVPRSELMSSPGDAIRR
jgi:hypothetical protein